MAKYELSIAVADKEPSMTPGDIRKREGDIVGVMEPNSDLGYKTLDAWLFVPVEIATLSQFPGVRQALTMPYYEDGKIPGVDFGLGEVDDEPPKVAKFRYQISLSLLGDIDLNKTQDAEIIYQPFLRESRLINMRYFKSSSFFDLRYKDGVYETRRTHKKQRKIYEEEINGKLIRFIRPQDALIITELTEGESPWRQIHCSTATIGDDEEKVWNWSLTENLLKDKHTNDWLGVEIIG